MITRLNIKVYVSVLIFLLVLSCQGPVKDHDIKATTVDSLLVQFDRNHGPGVAIGIIQNGGFVYKKYFGQSNLNHDIPISEKSVFNIASLSKQFTAACIHLLAEEGQLSLDDDIRRHLPDFPSYGKPISIKNLLFHTSGIRDYTELLMLGGTRLFKGYDNDEAIQMIYRQKSLSFEPGKKWMYSNSNYILLKEIIEKVSGESLEEFAKQNIFGPLGMLNTQYNGSHESVIKNRVTRYRTKDGKYAAVPDNDFTIGDGGIFSNLDDFLRWDQNFYNSKIGSKEFVESQEKSNVEFELGREIKGYYASGLMIMDYRGQKLILHGGGDAGIQTGYFRFPNSNFSVVSMANTNEYDFFGISLKIADLYLKDSLKDQLPERNEEIQVVPKPPKKNFSAKELEEYVGYYFSNEVDYFIEIVREEGKLKMPDTNAPGFLPVSIIEKDSLKLGPGKAKFHRDLQGKITGFSFDLDGGRVTGVVYKKQN